MDKRKKVIRGLEICKEDLLGRDTCKITGCPYADIPDGTMQYKSCRINLMDDALSLLKEQEEAEEEVNGTLDKLIKETQNLLSKTPTDFDIVKGIIERSGMRKHFDEATIETGEHIITLRHGSDEVDLLFDKDGRIE